MSERPVDERGIPTMHNGYASPYCPEQPCQLCTGRASLRDGDNLPMTSWQWCQLMNTCASTVDWEKVFGR